MLERAWRDLLFGIRWHLKTPRATAAIVMTPACVAVLLAVCAAAAVLPTMRAIRMDPATALRHE